MYISKGSLPHLLSADCYASPAYHESEVKGVLHSSWHPVASWDQLAKSGDFVTLELLGQPIHIRNFDGELRAFSNICAHRHCLLTSQPQGHAAAMRCQYHGWEYGADGRTRHIPSPKNFVPLDREAHRLASFRVERCGQLVFVCLSNDAGTLRDQLGDFFEICESRFNDEWREFLKWQPHYDANWKVPIENSLESYHVPYIHADTFREDPGSERSQHVLLKHRTAFGTTLPFSPHSRLDQWFQRGEGWMLRRIGVKPSGEYWQHHVFPNLLFSFTDAISLCHCVLPIGPTSSVAFIRQFGRVGAARNLGAQLLTNFWGKIAAGITKQIVKEDMGLFGDIQKGLENSSNHGLLGACEERIHAFQQYLAEHSASWVDEEGVAQIPSR